MVIICICSRQRNIGIMKLWKIFVFNQIAVYIIVSLMNMITYAILSDKRFKFISEWSTWNPNFGYWGGDTKMTNVPNWSIYSSVLFCHFLDFREVRKALTRRPLEGCQLGLSKVPYPRSIQVSNIGRITEDSISAYFESSRSRGGGKVAVVMHNDKDCAVVTFESNEGKNARKCQSQPVIWDEVRMGSQNSIYIVKS